MRVGPLSNKQFIKYLHQHFVPVFVSNQEYAAGEHGTTELEHLVTIRQKTVAKGMRTATVQIYLLSPDGEPIDIMVVRDALDIRRLMSFMRRNVTAMNVEPGKQLIASQDSDAWIQRSAPKIQPRQLTLRFAAQYRPHQKIMVEDFVTLDQDEWSTFVPPKDGDANWAIPDKVARKILVRVYPYALNWDHDTDQIKQVRLVAKVIERNDLETLIALRGELAMTHYRYVKTSLEAVTSKLTGYVRIAMPEKLGAEQSKKPEIRIITEGARFGALAFEGFMESM